MSMDDAFRAWKERAADADIVSVAIEHGAKLREPVGGERVGPCPSCGGTDRFSINTKKRIFNCRGAGGGDVIAMVQHLTGVAFVAACEIINKEPPPDRDSELTDAEKAKAEQLKEQRRLAAADVERAQDAFRQRERGTLYDSWKAAKVSPIRPVDDYLEMRGVQRLDARLRCVGNMPYYAGGGDKGEILHRGPVMMAPIVRADGVFSGLHLTYIDLDAPKGKVRLVDSEGAGLPAKKVRGSKQGHRIELISHPAPELLVIGEGIEKVLAVYNAMKAAGWDLSKAAFWTSVDLGNLGGKAAGTVVHPTQRSAAGRPQRVPGPDPDMEAPAIEIPDTVVDLVLLGDAGSDPVTTQCAMHRAAQRWARVGRTVRIAWAPGVDFDELLLAAPGRETCERIAAIIDGAKESVAPVIAAPDPVRAPAAVTRDSAAPRQGKRARAEHGAAGPSSDGEAGAHVEASFPGDKAAAPPANGGNGGDPPAPPASFASAATPPEGNKKRSSRTGGSGGNIPPGGGGAAPVDPEREKHELHLKCAWLPQTDLGNVERYVMRYRDVLRWSETQGWFYWDGKRWSQRGADAFAVECEHATVRAIQEEAIACEREAKGHKLAPFITYRPTEPDALGNLVPVEQKLTARQKAKARKEKRERLEALAGQLRGWGRKSEKASAMAALARRAKSRLEVHPEELDANPMLINVANGTLVVRRPSQDDEPLIRLKPHDPADMITKISPVKYDPDATCPQFDKVMLRIQPSEGQRRFLRQWNGYSLTGDAEEQKLAIYYGASGQNGKGTLMETTAYVAGDYAGSVSIETFLQASVQKSGGQATPDLAKLPGIRMLRTGEPAKGARLDEALIKRVTGGDPIDARHNFAKRFFTFFPQFKLTIATNHKPRVSGDSAFWRRMINVPFLVQIPMSERDPHLKAKLREEASGILNWMLDGLRDYLESGLIVGDEIAAATAKYREDSDPIGRFMADNTVADPEGKVQSSMLFELWQAWAKCNDGPDYKQKGFSMALDDRGYERKQISVMFWMGIRTTKGVGDYVDTHGNPLRQSGSPDTKKRDDDDDTPF